MYDVNTYTQRLREQMGVGKSKAGAPVSPAVAILTELGKVIVIKSVPMARLTHEQIWRLLSLLRWRY